MGQIQISLLLVIATVLGAATVVHVVLYKTRDPVGAVLWLFICLSFPIAGPLVYLMFGINRIPTQSLRVRAAYESLKASLHSDEKPWRLDNGSLAAAQQPPADPKLSAMFDRLFPELPPTSGNEIQILRDGNQAYTEMLRTIQSATQSIHLQSYIFRGDRIGRMIMQALIERARAGVQVRVLYDRIGSMPAHLFRFFAPYRREANIEIHCFNLMHPLRQYWQVHLRNHRKLLVVDGRIAFTGGINISAEHVRGRKRRLWYVHDLHCRISGPAVAHLQYIFLQDWHFVTNQSPTALLSEPFFPPLEAKGDTLVRIVPSGPGQHYRASAQLFLVAATVAREKLWLTTPYFIPDQPFLESLMLAAYRGVDVRLLLPHETNHWYTTYATRALYYPLLRAGVQIYEYQGHFTHAKALLVDNTWALMGSSNCDVRSFSLNFELDFVAVGGQFIQDLRTQLGSEFHTSRQIDYLEAKSKSLPRRFAENACLLLTPVL